MTQAPSDKMLPQISPRKILDRGLDRPGKGLGAPCPQGKGLSPNHNASLSSSSSSLEVMRNRHSQLQHEMSLSFPPSNLNQPIKLNTHASHAPHFNKPLKQNPRTNNAYNRKSPAPFSKGTSSVRLAPIQNRKASTEENKLDKRKAQDLLLRRNSHDSAVSLSLHTTSSDSESPTPRSPAHGNRTFRIKSEESIIKKMVQGDMSKIEELDQSFKGDQ